MTGKLFRDAALDGDAAKVSMPLSTQGVQSFINYQEAHGADMGMHRHKAAPGCAL